MALLYFLLIILRLGRGPQSQGQDRRGRLSREGRRRD